MTWIRRIPLDKEEYTFRFNNPKGALTKCTVISGAGTVTLYEIKSVDGMEDKYQVGDSHFLALDPGHTFYVALNTAKEKSNWEIAFRGSGTFKLELPERLLSSGKKGSRTHLSRKDYDKQGRKKS